MKTIKYFSAISFLFITAGCLQVETIVTVNGDGSGTIKETVVMGEFLSGILLSFSNSFNEDTVQQEDEDFFFKEEDFIKKSLSFGEGVSYVESSEINMENKMGYNALYSFDDVNKIKISQDPDSNSPLDMDDMPDTSGKNNLTFEFKKGNPSHLLIYVPIKEMEDEIIKEESAKEDSSIITEEEKEQLLQLMGDFKIESKIKINGEIKKSNAAFISGSEITILSIDLTKLIDDIDKLQKLNEIGFKNFSQLIEFIKNIPGFKMELQNKIFVEFE